MSVVPVVNPDTIPDAEPIVATEGEDDVQAPPPPSVRAVVAPVHTLFVPVIAGGAELTVTIVDVPQPLVNE